ncbi:MAG: phosphate ABC transporter substrate-binding protein [Succiniclasticum sp.]|nr:phosphate ABC transporter substrate-binding protein [Succiniclasticum sp.]MDY6086594.1 phosphate ABC transporter substrate-binding protein [Succiniclasticum sp.]
MLKKLLATVFIALLSIAALTGCGGGSSGSKPAAGGKVATDGSTSMEKVIGILGEAFQKDNPGITFTYNPTGSGSGITAVANDRCDIGLSSRKLKDKEKESGLVETVLAYDGIAMVVHPNSPVSDLKVEDIAKIYKGEIKNWKELGGKDSEIVCIGREAGSGTRDGFESITKTKDKCKYRQELTSTGDVIATVASNPNAIGYASLSAVKKTVKAVTVNGVQPSEKTVKDGSYVVQRPFVLVTKKDKKLSQPAQLFFDYATSEKVRDLISKAGVVAAK